MNRETAIQLALFGVAAVAAYWFVIRPASKVVGAVGDAYSPGGAAYEAGNAIQDAIIPGVDSLGTWAYGATHGESSPLALIGLTGIGTPAAVGSSIGQSIGQWFRDLFVGDAGSLTTPAASAPKPGPAPAYDYGFGLGTGPLRPGQPGAADGYFVYYGT